jgi:hypothetical protein
LAGISIYGNDCSVGGTKDLKNLGFLVKRTDTNGVAKMDDVFRKQLPLGEGVSASITCDGDTSVCPMTGRLE